MKPCQSACSNCSAANVTGGQSESLRSAPTRPSAPMIQNMSKPRSAWIESNRFCGAGVGGGGIINVSRETRPSRPGEPLNKSFSSVYLK